MNFLPAALFVCVLDYLYYTHLDNASQIGLNCFAGSILFIALGIYQTERTKK